MEQITRTRPATAADFHRLADLAQERGLRVFEASPNHWYCTSHSDPFKLHVVTGFSCDCLGFLHNQRCSHHAALLAHLGWLPEIEDTAPALVKGSSCSAGRNEEWGAGHVVGCRPCTVCGGTGEVPPLRPPDAPALMSAAA